MLLFCSGWGPYHVLTSQCHLLWLQAPGPPGAVERGWLAATSRGPTGSRVKDTGTFGAKISPGRESHQAPEGSMEKHRDLSGNSGVGSCLALEHQGVPERTVRNECGQGQPVTAAGGLLLGIQALVFLLPCRPPGL